jgi:hypothetical protein
VTRAANAGVIDDVAAYVVCLAAGAGDGVPGSAAVPAAAMTTAPTAPVMSLLRVWVVLTMYSWRVVAAPNRPHV